MNSPLTSPVEMIRQGAPHLIRTDRQLEQYTESLFELTAKPMPTADEERAIDLLTLLIERYEADRFPIPDATPVEVLRFLLESNGLAQRDIAPELGSEATVSLILASKRPLTRDHIARLSRRFRVSPAVFFPQP